MSVLPIILQKKKLLGAKLNPSPPPDEVPEGAITTISGDYVKTLNGEYITILEVIPEGALMTLSGEFIKTLNNDFITI